MYIAAALNPQRPDNLEAGCPQHLVLFIGHSLAGSDNDAIAGMDSHRVNIFHITNDDAVIGAVFAYLVFYFLPASYRFLQQHLMNGTGSQSQGCRFIKFLPGGGEASSTPPPGYKPGGLPEADLSFWLLPWLAPGY
ncbi:hypothetical protein ES703_115411 [subsurface metagenome]